MKVILKDDVENLGLMGEVVEVKDGYANNYLIPRNLAVPATPSNLKMLDALKRQRLRKEAKKRSEALAQYEAINNMTLEFVLKAGEDGKLFGSVTSSDVADALREKAGVEVDRRKIKMGEHIKYVGEHEVEVNLYHDIIAKVLVKVIPEES